MATKRILKAKDIERLENTSAGVLSLGMGVHTLPPQDCHPTLIGCIGIVR